MNNNFLNSKKIEAYSDQLSSAINFAAFIAAVASFYLLIIDFEFIKIDDIRYLHSSDDHMITLRVAQNMATHGVPYFNYEEAVAANTSLFWPLILSILFYATDSQATAVALNIGISLALTGATFALAALFTGNLLLRFAIISFLFLSSAFRTYGFTGWEHIPQTFLVTLAFFLIHRASKDSFCIPTASMYVLALAFLMRPDVAPLIAITGFLWYLTDQRSRKLLTYLHIVALTIVPILYVFLMFHFYGDWRPNTAHLKSFDIFTSLSFGLSYIFSRSAGEAVPLILILLILTNKSKFSKFVLGVAMVHLSYVLLVGGDVFSNGRFLLLLLPTLVATIAREAERWGLKGKSSQLMPLSAVLLFVVLWNKNDLARQAFNYQQTGDSPIIEQIRIMHSVNNIMDPSDGSLGMHYLGVSFHAPSFHVVDFLGKAEPEIARSPIQPGPPGHNRWNYGYAFDQYNIAIVPVSSRIFERTQSEGYELVQKEWMFWEVAVNTALSSGQYIFVSPADFGNRDFGALVRNDLVHLFSSNHEQ